jgi:hypothetical protein
LVLLVQLEQLAMPGAKRRTAVRPIRTRAEHAIRALHHHVVVRPDKIIVATQRAVRLRGGNHAGSDRRILQIQDRLLQFHQRGVGLVRREGAVVFLDQLADVFSSFHDRHHTA